MYLKNGTEFTNRILKNEVRKRLICCQHKFNYSSIKLLSIGSESVFLFSRIPNTETTYL